MIRGFIVPGVLVLLVLGALSQLAGAAIIYGKAWLAPILIEHAYQDFQLTGVPLKPWPWADTAPVARLRVDRLRQERVVLEGDSGQVLAFGPGMALGTLPGEPGQVMISGHRDTHFAFLEELRAGDLISLEYGTRGFHYQVSDMLVADARTGVVDAPLPERGLLLVTCYPFDAIRPGGPWRYVVVARQRAGRQQ